MCRVVGVCLWRRSPTLLVLSITVPCVSGEWTKSNLGISSVGSVVEGSYFIDEVWLEWIKTVLDMEQMLYSVSLVVQELFNIHH